MRGRLQIMFLWKPAMKNISIKKLMMGIIVSIQGCFSMAHGQNTASPASLVLFAAGRLHSALDEIMRTYPAQGSAAYTRKYGASGMLDAKGLKLSGASASASGARLPYMSVLEENKADTCIMYCTNALIIKKALPQLNVVLDEFVAYPEKIMQSSRLHQHNSGAVI